MAILGLACERRNIAVAVWNLSGRQEFDSRWRTRSGRRPRAPYGGEAVTAFFDAPAGCRREGMMAIATRLRSVAGLGAGFAAVVIAGGLTCVMWPTLSDAEDKPASIQSAVQPSEETPAAAAAPDALITAAAGSPLDGLRISSQSWRRGGLGSKALITFTLRNANDYAVKDIEIACAFARRDGSHLTDRKRVLGEAVEMKSRKTFTRVHVGFVNVNADKAKCALVAANRV
jgi:hypothetical protein